MKTNENISYENELVNAMNSYQMSFKKQMKGDRHLKDIDKDNVIAFEVIDGNKKYPVVTIRFEWWKNHVEVYYFVPLAVETHYEYDSKTVDKDVLDIMKFVRIDR